MPETKQGGGHKRYGKNKARCARYYNENRRTKNKLKRYMKNNIGKDWDENKVNKAISIFKDLQYKKHKEHVLIG